MRSKFASSTFYIYAFLISFAVAIILTVLFNTSFFANTVIHAVANVIVTGRSGAKAILFIWYFPLLFGLIYFARAYSIDHKKIRLLIISSLSAVGLAYALNLIVYFYTLVKQGIPFWSYSIIHNNDTYTSMQFLHNHISKGAIAVWTQFLPTSTLGRIDDGTALLGTLPSWVFFILSIVILIAIVSLIFNFLLQEKSLSKRLPQGRRTAFMFLYAISSFMIIKSMFDGGPLSFEAIIGFSFLLIIFSEHIKRFQAVAASIIITYLVGLAVLFFCGYFPTDVHYTYHVFSMICVVGILLAIYTYYIRGSSRLTVLIAILAVIAFGVQINNDLDPISYSLTPVPANSYVYAISERDIVAPLFRKIGSAGDTQLYVFLPDREGYDVGDILSATDIPANMKPVWFPWVSCMPKGLSDIFTFSVVSSKALLVSTASTSMYSFVAIEQPAGNTSSHRYSIKMITPACYVGPATAFFEAVMSQYLPSFAIYDMNSSVYNNNFAQ